MRQGYIFKSNTVKKQSRGFVNEIRTDQISVVIYVADLWRDGDALQIIFTLGIKVMFRSP